jgi:hypothetical protein
MSSGVLGEVPQFVLYINPTREEPEVNSAQSSNSGPNSVNSGLSELVRYTIHCPSCIYDTMNRIVIPMLSQLVICMSCMRDTFRIDIGRASLLMNRDR